MTTGVQARMVQPPFFGDLKRPAKGLFRWSDSETRANTVYLRAGKTLFHEGDKADRIYRIESGTLKLSRVTADGRQLVLGFPADGAVIGLSGSRQHLYSAEAIDRVVLRPMLRSRVFREMIRNENAQDVLFEWIERRETELQRQVEFLSLYHPSARIAAFLTSLAGNQTRATKSGEVEIHLPMTQRDISTYLSIAPETCSRFLRRLRDKGIVRSEKPHGHGKTLIISDMTRLLEIANGEKD